MSPIEVDPFNRHSHLGGTPALCLYVIFDPRGPEESEKGQEVTSIAGVILDNFQVRVSGCPWRTETSRITNLHDCSEAEDGVRTMLSQMGKQGRIQSVAFETTNPGFSKVQAAWAT